MSSVRSIVMKVLSCSSTPLDIDELVSKVLEIDSNILPVDVKINAVCLAHDLGIAIFDDSMRISLKRP